MVTAKPITAEELVRVPEDERCCQSPSFISKGADNRNGLGEARVYRRAASRW